MKCTSKLSTKKLECCELVQENIYTVKYCFIYKNGLLYASITDALWDSKKNYTSIKAEIISKNKYLNGQVIYMILTMNSLTKC